MVKAYLSDVNGAKGIGSLEKTVKYLVTCAAARAGLVSSTPLQANGGDIVTAFYKRWCICLRLTGKHARLLRSVIDNTPRSLAVLAEHMCISKTLAFPVTRSPAAHCAC